MEVFSVLSERLLLKTACRPYPEPPDSLLLAPRPPHNFGPLCGPFWNHCQAEQQSLTQTPAQQLPSSGTSGEAINLSQLNKRPHGPSRQNLRVSLASPLSCRTPATSWANCHFNFRNNDLLFLFWPIMMLINFLMLNNPQSPTKTLSDHGRRFF